MPAKTALTLSGVKGRSSMRTPTHRRLRWRWPLGARRISLFAVGRNRRHGLADVKQFIPGHNARVPRRSRAEVNAGEVHAGNDTMDPGQCQRLGRVDTHNAGMVPGGGKGNSRRVRELAESVLTVIAFWEWSASQAKYERPLTPWGCVRKIDQANLRISGLKTLVFCRSARR